MGMGWIQRHRRHGALLALAALVLQIVLSFGHVHLHGMAQSAPAAITHPIALADKNSQTPAPIPVDNDDYCAVCASIFLASSAFAAAPARTRSTREKSTRKSRSNRQCRRELAPAFANFYQRERWSE